MVQWRSYCDLWLGAWCSFGFAVGLVAVFDLLVELGGSFLGVVVALQVTPHCKHKMSLAIVRTSSSLHFASVVCCRRSEEVSRSRLQMSVYCNLSGQCKSMSETQCQHLNVRDSMSETQFQRLNVRDSMSELDLLTCSCVFVTPWAIVYNLIVAYEGTVELSHFVFAPCTVARPLVNANRLCTAPRSRVICWIIASVIFLVQPEMLVGRLHGTHGGAIMMVI